MTAFNIWCEGYCATGQSSEAQFMGTFEADSFKEACQKLYESMSPNDQSYFSSDKMRIWGCRLFDNEIDARRSFG